MMILLRRLPGLLCTHTYVTYCLLILTCTVTYLLFKWNLLCTNIQAWQHANRMCKLYKEGRGAGTLCAPLCSQDDMRSITCHTTDKEAVFSVEWHDTRLVFKLASKDVGSLRWFENGIVRYPNEQEFLVRVRAAVRRKLNVALAYDTATRLTRFRSSYDEKDAMERQKEMDNLWVLVQDNEYLLSTIYGDKEVFPQVLGTCGPYFAVEYVEPLRDISSPLGGSDTKEEWANRLKVASQIVELLDEFEVGFREPFHLCDIKFQHFGYSKGGNKLKFIDLYAVYPRSMAGRIASRTCDKDEDCDFLDCRSRCLLLNRTCTGAIANSNLQVVCEKLFLGWRFSNTVMLPGLLMSQHTPTELAAILRQCADPEGGGGKARAGPDEEVKTRLTNVLSEVEQRVRDELFS